MWAKSAHAATTVRIVTGDPFGCYTHGEWSRAGQRIPLTVELANGDATARSLRWSVSAVDYWQRPVTVVPASGTIALEGGQARSLAAVLAPSGNGAFDVTVRLDGGIVAQRTIIVVPDPVAGLRPNSFFASNSGLWEHAPLWQKIGMKVARYHWAEAGASAVDWTAARQPGDPIRFDFREQDRRLAELASHDVSVLGIVGYARPEWARSPEAQRRNVYGPPRDVDEFVRATVPIVEHFRSIRVWEFWNEPWIGGWTWAGTAPLFRDFLHHWLAAAKSARPDIFVIGGSSGTFIADHLAPFPDSFRGLDGDSNHPYKDVSAPSLRSGSELRYIDYGVQVGNAAGLSRHYVTEEGTDVGLLSGEHDDRRNAQKLVTAHVLMALAGVFQGNLQEGLGWGVDEMRATAAYATMTHFLEDHVVVRDIFPAHPLLWAALFAGRDAVDERVARAETLRARWHDADVPEHAAPVAVVWSWAGPDGAHLDRGRMTLAGARDVVAYDLMGNPTGQRRGDRLTIELSPTPVYLTTRVLPPSGLAERIARARIDGLTAVNLFARSFVRPLDQPQDLVVTLQNQLNRAVDGTLAVELPAAFTRAPRVRVSLASGEVRDVRVPIARGVIAADNRYPLTLRFSGRDGTIERRQVVQAALVEARAITVDGELDDWRGSVAVTVDAEGGSAGPDVDASTGALVATRPKQVTMRRLRAQLAHDDTELHAAFVVEPPPGAAGEPPAPPPSSIVLAIGLHDRADDDARPPGDPWFWKGHFRDTDWQFALRPTHDGGVRLMQVAAPGLPYRTREDEGDPPPAGSRAVMHRDATTGVTTFELALPLAALHIDPGRPLERLRLAFICRGRPDEPPLEWAVQAGVFDFWTAHGSFHPTWQSFRAAQTPFDWLAPAR